MNKKIGYIEKNGVSYVSVKDVFDYLYEAKVISTEKQMCAYRWNFEKNLLQHAYHSYRSGVLTDADVPWIIDGTFYANWLRFEYADFVKVIKNLKNEDEVKQLVQRIDFHDFSRNRMFVKRKFVLR